MTTNNIINNQSGNIRTDDNVLSSTNTDGNIELTPDGNGIVVLANAQITNVTASRAVVTDGSSNLNESAVTATELGYVSGVTSAIQTQIDAINAADGKRDINQATHGLSVGDIVLVNGSGNYVVAQADTGANAEVVGVVSAVADTNNFTLQFGGYVTGLSGLTVGSIHYLDPNSAGALTVTRPTTTGDIIKPLLIADATTSGYWVNYLGIEIT